jgi:hypothetical protein
MIHRPLQASGTGTHVEWRDAVCDVDHGCARSVTLDDCSHYARELV